MGSAERRFGEDPVVTGRLGFVASGPELRRATSAVIFVHGSTTNAMIWKRLMSRLPGDTVGIAFDLRGRGSSFDLPGPFGFDRNVADIIDSMDSLGIPQATLVGHGLGCLTVTQLGRDHPDRVESALLLDGGVGPQFQHAEHAVAELLSWPNDAGSGVRFRSVEQYHQAWLGHPAVTDEIWQFALADVLDYSVARSGAFVIPKIRREALESEARAAILDESLRHALRDVVAPVELVRVDHPGNDSAPPGVSKAEADAVVSANPNVETTFVPGASPFSLIMTRSGVDVCAAALHRVRSRINPLTTSR